MRNKTEARILEAFLARKPLTLRARRMTSYLSNIRDRVECNNAEDCTICELWGTSYALRQGNVLTLGVADGDWQTVTTKRRINSIAEHYNLPRIYQRFKRWTWSDGVFYTGVRDFDLTPSHLPAACPPKVSLYHGKC